MSGSDPERERELPHLQERFRGLGLVYQFMGEFLFCAGLGWFLAGRMGLLIGCLAGFGLATLHLIVSANAAEKPRRRVRRAEDRSTEDRPQG